MTYGHCISYQRHDWVSFIFWGGQNFKCILQGGKKIFWHYLCRKITSPPHIEKMIRPLDQILGKEEKKLNFQATVKISVVSWKDARDREHTTQDRLSKLLENHIRQAFCSYLSLLVAHNSCDTYELERFDSASDRFVESIGYMMREVCQDRFLCPIS